MAILAFGFTSCDEEFIEATPQHNPQEPLMSYEGLTVEKGEAIATALDLNTAGDELQLIKTTATPVLTEGQTIEYIAFLSSKETFTPQKEIAVPQGVVSKDKLNTAVRDLFGDKNGAKDVYIRFAAYLVDGTSRVMFGDNKTFFASSMVSITPIDVEFHEPTYIYVVGTPNGWDINSGKVPLTCSTGQNNIFIGKVNLSAGENIFRFYKELGNWDTNSWGSQVDDNPVDITDGFKDGVYNGSVTEGKGSFKMATNGVYKLTVDIVNKTIKIEVSEADPVEATHIYMVGTINGWSLDPAKTEGKLDCTTGDQKYIATLTLPDSGDGFSLFRFYSALPGDNNWSTNTIGTDSGTDEVLEFDGAIAMAAVVPGKEGAFKVPAGTYDVEVDLNENILTLTQK